MLLPTYFIVDYNLYDEIPDIDLPENAFISFKIDVSDFHAANPFYQKVFTSKSKNRFCILLSFENIRGGGEKDEFVKIIDNLVPLTFHKNYLKRKYDCPVLIFDQPTKSVDDFILNTKKAFRAHGYEDILVIVHSSDESTTVRENKNIYFKLKNSTDNIIPNYSTALTKLTSTDWSVFFWLSRPKILPELLITIQESETLVSTNSPHVFQLLQETLVFKKKENELLFRIGLLEDQLGSLSNNQLDNRYSKSLYKQQITEILDFYKTEYEILPSWFKRMGHIVKVLTGKRTFKSLFNDKVKKYKV